MPNCRCYNCKKRSGLLLSDSKKKILIHSVKVRVCLWDDRHDHFKNKSVTKKLWDDIGAVISISGEDAKKEWDFLKYRYRKELLTSGPQKKKWRFSRLMRFMKYTVTSDQLVDPSATFPLPIMNTGNSENFETWHDMDKVGEEHMICPVDVRAESAETFTGNPAKNVMEVTAEHPETAMFQIEKEQLNAIFDFMNNSKQKEEGDDYQFLMSLLPHMKNLNPLLKLKLRGKILKEVTHSCKINQQTATSLNRTQTQTNSSLEIASTEVSPTSPPWFPTNDGYEMQFKVE